MKKLFSIFALTMVIGLFSSCIIVGVAQEPEPATYDFYFENDSDKDIRDWYLLDRNGNRYSKQNDGYACPIEYGDRSSIKNLRSRDYRVFYEKYTNSSNTSYTQHYTGFFTLDSDVTFYLDSTTISRGKPHN